MLTNVKEGQTFEPGKKVALQGVAWDGGHGIRKVEASLDGGRSWNAARLGTDYGPFSWRQFFYSFTPQAGAQYDLRVRAVNRAGQTQGQSEIPNPAGYHFNAIQELHVSSRAPAGNGEGEIRFPDGPGKDLVVGNCSTCHSLDYIQMNSPFLDKKGWEAVVKKMKVSMGAPVSDQDFPIIVEYLGRHFGK
jgi:hypothetical protein